MSLCRWGNRLKEVKSALSYRSIVRLTYVLLNVLIATLKKGKGKQIKFILVMYFI